MKHENITLLGYACGLAAGDPGCADGPVELQSEFKTLPLLYPDINGNDKYKIIAELSQRLAERVEQSVYDKKPFIVFAGDHSCAIGTWSGASVALEKDIGLIWVDAHLDAHTTETSPSGNIHGMPVASLLGHGNHLLSSVLDARPKIKPENICFIGVRSFEVGEHELVTRLGVKVFYIDEVKQRGLDVVFKEAKNSVTRNTPYYGVSIDLDGIDPSEAPGVGTPEKNGLSSQELCDALRKYCHRDPKLLGVEITEFNPHHDINGKTRDVIRNLVKSIYTIEEKGEK